MKTFEVRTAPCNPRWFIAFFAYLAAIHLRFAAYNFTTLAGDDIILLGGSNQKNGFVSTFWPSFTDHAQGARRPIEALDEQKESRIGSSNRAIKALVAQPPQIVDHVAQPHTKRLQTK